MGRPYTDEQRAEIKQRIKEIAAEMFTKQGYKDFRIQQLTQRAGISLGGFYTFYKDKEALYEEILREEKNRIRKKIIMLVENKDLTPQDFLTDLSAVFLDKTSSNQFYTSEYNGLFETMVWNNEAATAQDNLHFIRQIRRMWSKKGIEIKASDEELVSAIAVLAVLCSNKDKIGPGFDTWYARIENLIFGCL